jgi:aspartyl-tRNA(Asn)/glutamyl-tRNA(Gln) amidotransferase subunit C
MDSAEILHIAKLSRLKLSDDEWSVYSHRFTEILKMVNAIGEVSTDGVLPMRHPFDAKTHRTDMRNDMASPPHRIPLTQEDEPYFYVPKVIET